MKHKEIGNGENGAVTHEMTGRVVTTSNKRKKQHNSDINKKSEINKCTVLPFVLLLSSLPKQSYNKNVHDITLRAFTLFPHHIINKIGMEWYIVRHDITLRVLHSFLTIANNARHHPSCFNTLPHPNNNHKK